MTQEATAINSRGLGLNPADRTCSETFISTIENLTKDNCEDALFLEMKHLASELSKCCVIFQTYLSEFTNSPESKGQKKILPISKALEKYIKEDYFNNTNTFFAAGNRSKFFRFPQNLVNVAARSKPQYSKLKFNADLIITVRHNNKDKNKGKDSATESFLKQSLKNNIENNKLPDGGSDAIPKSTGIKRNAEQLTSEDEPPHQIRIINQSANDPNTSASDSLIIIEMRKLLEAQKTVFNQRFDSNDTRLDNINKNMKENIEIEVKKEVDAKMQEINPRLEKVEKDTDKVTNLVNSYDQKFRNFDEKSAEIDRAIQATKENGPIDTKIEEVKKQFKEFKESKSLDSSDFSAPGAVTRDFLEHERQRRIFSASAHRMVSAAQLKVNPKTEFTKVDPATGKRIPDEVKMKNFLGTGYTIKRTWPRDNDTLGMVLRLHDDYKNRIKKVEQAKKLVKNRSKNGGIGIEFDFEEEYSCQMDFEAWKAGGYIKEYATTHYGKWLIIIDDTHKFNPGCPRDLVKLVMNDDLTENLIKLTNFSKYFHHNGKVQEIPSQFVHRKEAIIEKRMKRDEKQTFNAGARPFSTNKGQGSTQNPITTPGAMSKNVATWEETSGKGGMQE